jgi:hypothetical protein
MLNPPRNAAVMLGRATMATTRQRTRQFASAYLERPALALLACGGAALGPDEPSLIALSSREPSSRLPFADNPAA